MRDRVTITTALRDKPKDIHKLILVADFRRETLHCESFEQFPFRHSRFVVLKMTPLSRNCLWFEETTLQETRQ
ncbi:hypothetical protein Y032_0141g2245 [Ancylostoma ceylanicum]|uniref:Uncharacterized protein n=1 Tax=Ancylostoma ceylanicum TaxID=53326 RepID=A0A016T309_9BILA|nr:hypothetical protein Y032_0141g2245 [Ancylostoma ceylanicum]